jgi:hypothetical protein
VFVEYVVNDGHDEVRWTASWRGRVYERLLRKLLTRPKKPAVVLMQVRGLAPGRSLALGLACTRAASSPTCRLAARPPAPSTHPPPAAAGAVPGPRAPAA